MMNNLITRAKNSLKDFWDKTNEEVTETVAAEKILTKYLKGQTVNQEERKFLGEQLLDILKIIFIGIPLVIIPGFSIVMLFLVKFSKKMGVNIFPSSFK